jgi:hypothetical protein
MSTSAVLRVTVGAHPGPPLPIAPGAGRAVRTDGAPTAVFRVLDGRLG